MRKNFLPIYVFVIFILAMSTTACHEGVGCPADQYNDWKKIEAARKQQTKSPNNPNKTGKNGKKPNVYGNGIVPQ
jgi:hypothetical protein